MLAAHPSQLLEGTVDVADTDPAMKERVKERDNQLEEGKRGEETALQATVALHIHHASDSYHSYPKNEEQQ